MPGLGLQKSYKIDISQLTDDQKVVLLSHLKTKEEWLKNNQATLYYTDAGKNSRDNYPKHMTFFKAGASFKERFFIAGNRVGKTHSGSYEDSLHATGDYPEWWEGKKFTKPTVGWCCSDTPQVIRVGIQDKLLGGTRLGTGFIPKNRIIKTVKMPQNAGVYSEVHVEHRTNGVPDGVSIIYFMPYSLKREKFQAAAVDYIHLDEEPPDVQLYAECITRLMTTQGVIYSTFTPLSALSELVHQLMPDGMFPKNMISGDKFVMQMTMHDAHHLTEEDIKYFVRNYPAAQRDARVLGLPLAGSGLVYATNVPVTDVLVPWFKIPDEWPRVYSMDVGYKVTAALFLTKDPNSDRIYVYDEYVGEEKLPLINGAAIKSKGGDWMYGFVDPASKRTESDGLKLFNTYREDCGLNLYTAKNPVDAGIMKVLGLLASDNLKIMSSCPTLIKEYGIYRYDKHGKIKKEFDHCIDCLRYAVTSGMDHFTTKSSDEDIDSFYGTGKPTGYEY